MTCNRRENYPARCVVRAAVNIARHDLPQAARILANNHIPFSVARRVLLTQRRPT